MYKYILMLTLCLIIIACTASKKIAVNESTKQSPKSFEPVVTTPIPKVSKMDTLPPDVFKIDTVYKQSSGSCFGKCPVYEFAILNDGTVLWKGMKNIDKTGTFISKIDQVKIIELQQNVRSILQQNYAEFYPLKAHEVVHDFPLITYKFFDKLQVKKISINNSAPKRIGELETKIQEWFQFAEWIKIDQ